MLGFSLLSILACLWLGHVTNALMVTNLADILRSAGLNVTEVDGWKTRAHGPLTAVRSIICHHTAGPPTGDYPSLPIVRDQGRSQEFSKGGCTPAENIFAPANSFLVL
jgi:hypothetical protein